MRDDQIYESTPPWRQTTITTSVPVTAVSYPGHDVVKELFDYGIDTDARKIYLIGDIERDLVASTIQAIGFFNSPRMKNTAATPITLIIASDGGDVHIMFALVDAIRLSNVPIYTLCTGVVASAATLILVSGHKRFATPNAYVMHHQLSADITGNLDELATQTKVTNTMAAAFYRIMGERTNKPAKFWSQAAKRKNELWLQPEKMIEYGVVDEILKEEVK